MRVRSLVEELRRQDRLRDLLDYIWWSGHDSADYADGKLAEALAELRAGALGGDRAIGMVSARQLRGRARHDVRRRPGLR